MLRNLFDRVKVITKKPDQNFGANTASYTIYTNIGSGQIFATVISVLKYTAL